MFWLPIVVVGRVVPCHFATWALVISAPNPPVALQCYQTQRVRTPWGGKGGRGLQKKVWEWSLRQVWTFVGPSSICPHSFSGSAFCSWFWHCLSCFGLPQPAHMITSVDHLKTMDPGRINATCFTFVRRYPLLRLSGLNWFSVKIVLELMPWKRGTCVTPTLKSPASWSRWDLFKNFVWTLTIRCGGKCFVIQLIFFTLSAFLSPRQVWLLSTLTWGDQIWKIVTILWISSLLATPEFGNLKHKKKSKKSNKTAMIISTSTFCNLELKKKSNKTGGMVIVDWHWL